MAILKKDRGFEEILKDVVMEEVPIEYVTHIQLKLSTGQVIEFARDELVGMRTAGDVLKASGMEYLRNEVVDIEVHIDSSKIKNRVVKYVRDLLSDKFDEK